MTTNHSTKITGFRKIAEVIKYLDYQRSITGNVTGDDYAMFYIQHVPGANDESDYHIARSILKRLDNEGYIKFTDNSFSKDFPGVCVVQYLPKYRWIRLRYIFAAYRWEVTNPLWYLWISVRVMFSFVKWLWVKSRSIFLGISVVSGLFIVDWVLAWKNFKIVWEWVKSIILI